MMSDNIKVSEQNEFTTFNDLYEFLQEYNDCLIKWINNPWKGKDKQESLLRLFAGLDLIDKLKNYKICKGNFNLNNIIKHTSFYDIFYNDKNEPIRLKDKGDKSDLTMIDKANQKNILVTSSKNRDNEKNEGIGKYDIRDIHSIFTDKYNNDKELIYCICTKNKERLIKKINNCEECNKDIQEKLLKTTTIIIDWNDLNQAYNQFKMYFGQTKINNIINSNKTTLCLKMHQHLGVLKTLRMKNCEKKKILWGHIQRSGKSYIIGGSIIEDSKDKNECNYLVITTAPKETIDQQAKVFDCIQLKDFNIVKLNGKNKKPALTKKNIIICSKQFLQTKIDKGNDKNKHSEEKTKSITWLKEMSFDIRFIDESHNGGTTELAKKTLDFYGKQAFTVQITATYSKPINDYNIPQDCWILWDLEDIKLCKNITDEGSIIRLSEKHGECIKDIISKYSLDNIITEYSKYPELVLLTHCIYDNFVKEIIEKTKNNPYGWSPEACFLLKQGYCIVKNTNKVIKKYKAEFQNEEAVLKLLWLIFGKKDDEFKIPDDEYPDDKVFLKIIENICNNPETSSRFIRKGDFHNEPMIIMAFLPQNNINLISEALTKLIIKHKILPDFDIVSINSKRTDDPKGSIEEARIKARNSGKKGVLVLSGRQCSLGVSIKNCDIVLLLNNNMSFDMIYQMMFRCMTEDKNKTRGFVVDLNINRVIQTTLKYSSLIKPNLHPKDAIKSILQERLINLNPQHMMLSFGNIKTNIDKLSNDIYKIYSSQLNSALDSTLQRFNLKMEYFSKGSYEVFNTIFKNIKLSNKKNQELLEKVKKELEPNKIKKGIEKIEVKIDNIEEVEEEAEEADEYQDDKNKINPFDILKPVCILISLLTCNEEEATTLNDMNKLIELNKDKKQILIDQVRMWWGKNIQNEQIEVLINIFVDYMNKDKETEQLIRTIKELFCKNISNRQELSKVIDKYLIPQELEKKSNAEVSTPYNLRQEMLDKIPVKFWTSKKKVFEPCSGKGGFIIDIIDRFMNGLKDKIIDEKERYKTIVEECLYFSDINKTNIFICKLLIDPYNEYELKYNEGNTLELDIKEKWKIKGFDAVIGNPPYQKSSGNKGKGNTLWNLFVVKSLNNWLIHKGLLIFVHPQGWRQLDNKTGLLMLSKQILYLNMNDVKKGIEIFNCSTTYDFYVLQNCPVYKNTKINDYKNIEIEYNLKNTRFIPNHSIGRIQKHLDFDNEYGLIKDRSNYGTERKWVSKNKNDIFKYPCIYTINTKNEISLRWSKINNNGHFGITKYILSNGNGYYKDIKGEYGCTEWSYYINCNIKDMDHIYNCFKNIEFLNIIDAVKLTSNKYNYVILKYLKKDFWKEFI